MMKSNMYLNQFLEDCTLSRMIRWVDEFHDNAWSKSIESASLAVSHAQTMEEIAEVDAKYLSALKRMVGAYHASDEHGSGLLMEAAQLLSNTPKDEMVPLGLIIHKIVYQISKTMKGIEGLSE